MLTTMLAPSQARHKLKTSEVRCERRSAACPVVSLTVAQTEVNTIHFKALHQECPAFTVNTAAGLFFSLSLFLMQGKNPNHHALHVSFVAHICFVLTISYTMQRLVLCCAIFFSHLTQPAYLSDKGHAQDIILLRSIPCICLLLYLCLIKGTPCIRFLKGTDTLGISHRRHTLYLFLLRAHPVSLSPKSTPCISFP